jgi:quinol monooxygenase YgiN
VSRKWHEAVHGVKGHATASRGAEPPPYDVRRRLEGSMYGLIGQIVALPGKRMELAAILAGTGSMPGCLSYVVADDTADPDSLWVTEVWESKQAHTDSLALPAVQQAIAKGQPLIASFASRIETDPVGGIGLQ